MQSVSPLPLPHNPPPAHLAGDDLHSNVHPYFFTLFKNLFENISKYSRSIAYVNLECYYPVLRDRLNIAIMHLTPKVMSKFPKMPNSGHCLSAEIDLKIFPDALEEIAKRLNLVFVANLPNPSSMICPVPAITLPVTAPNEWMVDCLRPSAADVDFVKTAFMTLFEWGIGTTIFVSGLVLKFDSNRILKHFVGALKAWEPGLNLSGKSESASLVLRPGILLALATRCSCSFLNNGSNPIMLKINFNSIVLNTIPLHWKYDLKGFEEIMSQVYQTQKPTLVAPTANSFHVESHQGSGPACQALPNISNLRPAPDDQPPNAIPSKKIKLNSASEK